MNRRTPEELKKLTIPRLQALLKATRARHMSVAICTCCGEPFTALYEKDHPFVKRAAPYKAYFEDVKAELKRQQENKHVKR